MGMTIDRLKELCEGEGFKYFLAPDRPMVTMGFTGITGRYQFIIPIELEGRFIQLRTVSYLECPADHPHLNTVLAIIGAFRELVGTGKLLGIELLSPQWYTPNQLILLAPGAFVALGSSVEISGCSILTADGGLGGIGGGLRAAGREAQGEDRDGPSQARRKAHTDPQPGRGGRLNGRK